MGNNGNKKKGAFDGFIGDLKNEAVNAVKYQTKREIRNEIQRDIHNGFQKVLKSVHKSLIK